METHRKNPGSHSAVRAISALLPRISDENLVRLTYLGQLLTNDAETLRAIAKVRYYLQSPEHPAQNRDDPAFDEDDRCRHRQHQ